MDINAELLRYGLTSETYEACLKDIYNKMHGVQGLDWQEIVDKYDLGINKDTLRKASQTIFGGAFVREYFDSNSPNSEDDYDRLLELKNEIKKERVKLQAAQLDSNRLTRLEGRLELFYESLRDVIINQAYPHEDCVELLRSYDDNEDKEYLLAIGDIHAGAKFQSLNNCYSIEEMHNRLNLLQHQVINFINKNNLHYMKILIMGDEVQGILRLTDLSLNQLSVPQSVVEVASSLAHFINEVSKHVLLDVYYVPTSNHNQTRPLGTKANELMNEDVSYIIGNYIKDMLVNNLDKVRVHLDFKNDFVTFNIFDFNVLAMHGHQVKNVDEAIKNYSFHHKVFYDYLFLAHFHSSKSKVVGENDTHDIETIVVPSIVGSDPYSDSLKLGAKSSAMIYGFDRNYGKVETYKFILN